MENEQYSVGVKYFIQVNVIALFVVLLSGLSIAGAYLVSGHLPVYDKFATLQNIVFILSLLTLIFNRNPQSHKGNIRPMWYIILFLQAFILTQNFELNSNNFMYDKSYVVPFFQFRITAIALFVFALGNHLSLLIHKQDKLHQNRILRRARIFMILGALLYLAGELSGSYWAFLWWGDPWHWSKGFFLSSTMFLLSMLSSHLPSNLSNTTSKKCWVNIIATSSILTIYFISH